MIRKHIPFLWILMHLLISCAKEEDPSPQPPASGNNLEILADVSSLLFDNGSMSITGSVSSKDGFQIKERGFCHGSQNFPVLKTDSIVAVNAGFGSFSATFKLPDFASIRYLRPYAISISSAGKTDTSYGNQLLLRPFHQVKSLRLKAFSTDSIQFVWDGLSLCRIPGLQDVSSKGICWSLSPNPLPLVSGSNVKEVTGNDSLGISSFVTGLQAGSVYYFRAFSVSFGDTVFGNAVACGTGITDIDGNFYPGILIGKQLWMTANLRTTRFSDNTPLEINPDSAVWNSFSACANSGNNQVFGRFYNYRAVISNKNLCPAGWKIPSRQDLDTLLSTLGGWENAGLALKAGTTAWGSSISEGQGSSGFQALPSGKKNNSGVVELESKLGFWWLSGPATFPQAFRMTNLDQGVFVSQADSSEGLSIRCLRRF